MRGSLTCLLLFCLIVQAPAPNAEGGPAPAGVDFRIVFRYRAQGPASGNDYESEVTVFERLAGGGEKKVGTFAVSD